MMTLALTLTLNGKGGVLPWRKSQSDVGEGLSHLFTGDAAIAILSTDVGEGLSHLSTGDAAIAILGTHSKLGASFNRYDHLS